MRVAFLLALLAASVFYTWLAFADLALFGRTGRLGPGFFPRLIGVGLILMCLLSLRQDMARLHQDDVSSPYWTTVAALAALSGGMIWLFTLVGGPIAMAAFLLASLTLLNRRQPLVNVAVAVLLPLAVFLLFDVWLNASMPQGRLLSI